MLKRLLILGVLVSLLFLAGPVFAESTQSGNRSQGFDTANEVRPSPFPTPRRALNEVRLRACQSRENAIQNRMQSLTRLVGTIEKSFDSIATRVENYYTNKVLPDGNTIPNYADLVADIAAKKAVVDIDLPAVQENMNSFGCDGDDPKGAYNEFRLGMQNIKTDLKNYRTSIKNLIVAVAKVAPKETPEATETP